MRNWAKLLLGLLGLLVLLLLPPTRMLIIWLLPIGGRPDDLIIAMVLTAGIVLLIAKWRVIVPKVRDWLEEKESDDEVNW